MHLDRILATQLGPIVILWRGTETRRDVTGVLIRGVHGILVHARCRRVGEVTSLSRGERAPHNLEGLAKGGGVDRVHV